MIRTVNSIRGTWGKCAFRSLYCRREVNESRRTVPADFSLGFIGQSNYTSGCGNRISEQIFFLIRSTTVDHIRNLCKGIVGSHTVYFGFSGGKHFRGIDGHCPTVCVGKCDYIAIPVISGKTDSALSAWQGDIKSGHTIDIFAVRFGAGGKVL